jgi:hypothetical protein
VRDKRTMVQTPQPCVRRIFWRSDLYRGGSIRRFLELVAGGAICSRTHRCIRRCSIYKKGKLTERDVSGRPATREQSNEGKGATSRYGRLISRKPPGVSLPEGQNPSAAITVLNSASVADAVWGLAAEARMVVASATTARAEGAICK